MSIKERDLEIIEYAGHHIHGVEHANLAACCRVTRALVDEVKAPKVEGSADTGDEAPAWFTAWEQTFKAKVNGTLEALEARLEALEESLSAPVPAKSTKPAGRTRKAS